MTKLWEKLEQLFKNKNFIRAAIIYGVSITIGGIGFLVCGGVIGWYFITCPPGLGSGVALALLNNGHKKPVTWKGIASTVGMTIFFAVLVYFLSDGEIFPVFIGWALSFVGSAIGLWFCRWENKKYAKEESIEVVAKGEMIDIFDANENHIGVMEKWEAHKKHQWHKNSHTWVTDGKNVLVQRRASDKPTFPDKWDISSAGHFGTGDTPLACAKREWDEELGLPWEFGDVEPDLMKAWGVWDGEPVYEFIYFFFLKGAPDISKAKLQESEVSDLKWLPFDEFKKQIKTDLFCPFGEEYWGIVVDSLGRLMDKK